MPREEPESLPPMRARTPSGHDPIEDVFRRLGSVENKASEIVGLRMRQDMLEREVGGIKTKIDDTGQHVIDDKVAAQTYKAVIEEERRKRAEAEKTLADKLAEEQRGKRMALLERAIIAIAGLILGYFAHGLHLP